MESNLFPIYVFIWAVLGVIFYFLDKRAEDTATRKKIKTVGIMSIFLLMICFILLQKGNDGKFSL